MKFSDKAKQEGLAAFEESKYDEAFALLIQCATNGDTQCQGAIGSMYLYGFGIEKNLSEALKWLKTASDNGWGPASDNLGSIYLSGLLGAEINDQLAKQYFELAKTQGFKF